MLSRRMRNWWFKAGVATLLLAGALNPTNAAATPTDTSFAGGSLTGLTVNPAFTEASFQNLSYNFEGCGTEAAEETCTWEVRLQLHSDPARRCVPSTPESQLLWDSGRKSGNGSVQLGPLGFGLEGCPGEDLGASYEARKTYNPEEETGAWKVLATGWNASLFWFEIGPESSREMEERIIAANPPAQPSAPNLVPMLMVGPGCHSVKIGSARYAFVFQRMGCNKATSLASLAYLSNAAPNGYACENKRGGGKRCWRRGQPQKYLEWHSRR